MKFTKELKRLEKTQGLIMSLDTQNGDAKFELEYNTCIWEKGILKMGLRTTSANFSIREEDIASIEFEEDDQFCKLHLNNGKCFLLCFCTDKSFKLKTEGKYKLEFDCFRFFMNKSCYGSIIFGNTNFILHMHNVPMFYTEFEDLTMEDKKFLSDEMAYDETDLVTFGQDDTTFRIYTAGVEFMKLVENKNHSMVFSVFLKDQPFSTALVFLTLKEPITPEEFKEATKYSLIE